MTQKPCPHPHTAQGECAPCRLCRIEVEHLSVSAGKQVLVMDRKDIEYMNGKRILIVDDVISTGGSLHALETLAAKSTGTIVGCCAALAEGDAANRTDITFLAPLPLFLH